MRAIEDAILTSIVLTLILTFIVAGEFALADEVEQIPVPQVIHHDIETSAWEVESVCHDYVTNHKLPCTVVRTEGRICYAKMLSDGSSQPVQCFNRIQEEWADSTFIRDEPQEMLQ